MELGDTITVRRTARSRRTEVELHAETVDGVRRWWLIADNGTFRMGLMHRDQVELILRDHQAQGHVIDGLVPEGGRS